MYKVRGGVRYGRTKYVAINASWPFGLLVISETQIYLSALGSKWIFEKNSDNVLIEIQNGFFGKGMRILHQNPKYPKYLAFWAGNLQKLCEALRLYGYSFVDLV